MKTWFDSFGGPKMTVGVGVSLLIGGAASVLLILQSAKMLSKVGQRKISKKRSDKCVHCEAKVELDKLKEFVTCKGCEELACHNQKCSEFIHGLNVWECARCKKNRVIQQRAGEWLLRQLNQMTDGDDGSVEVKKENILNVDDDKSLAAFVSRNQRDKVRQFIEELLAKMLGGPLDDVSVGQLSNDENCLPIIGPIPSTTSHHELRKFVQGICEEVINISSTCDFSGVPGRLQEPVIYFDPKKYDQLLATAVLNKMTELSDKSSQHNSSGVHSDMELDSNHNQMNGKAVIDLMVKRDDSVQFSSPTIERLNSKALDDETHLTDYVQSHFVPLPDLSTDSANDDVDIQSVNSSNGTDGTWEDNWLFKKRKLKTESQSIAMLVPSPTEEIKALIGDKNADETSDLSENSDEEDDGEEKEMFTNTLLIQPKMMEIPIAEVSAVSATSDSLKSMQSLVSLDTENPHVITEAKNNLLLVDDDVFKKPLPVQKINFVLNGAVTTAEKPLGELQVDIGTNENPEEEFDSIVSPTQVREHKKSIDEQFEKLLLDDNNNNEILELENEIFKSPAAAEIAKKDKRTQAVSKPTEVSTAVPVVSTATTLQIASLPEAQVPIVSSKDSIDSPSTPVSSKPQSTTKPDENSNFSIEFSPQHQQFQNHHHHELSEVPFSELYKALKASEPPIAQHHDLTAINEDLLDSEDWEMVPSGEEVNQLQSLESESISVDTNTSLQGNPSSEASSLPSLTKSDTFESQAELADLQKDNVESPTHRRYSSPLFQKLLSEPIEPIKIRSPLTETENDVQIDKVTQPSIPEDSSINNLLHTASLVSKTQKASETIDNLENELTKTKDTNNDEEIQDEEFLNGFSVAEKRPSLNDPEKVLMQNVVPGSIAEREHIKWLHAAPIANNPYSSEALQRRLSETDNKQKNLVITNNSKLVDALVEESNASEAEKEENEEVFRAKQVDLRKYKRDYYINEANDGQKRLSSSSTTSKSTSFEVEDDQSDNIVPVTKGENVFRARSFNSGEIDSAGGSVASDPDSQQSFLTPPKSLRSNDDSLNYSEDSDTTRIYNLNTRETKLVAPESEKAESPIESPVKIGQQFFRGSPKKVNEVRKMDDEVTTVIRTSNVNLLNGAQDSDNHIVQEIYEEKQVIEPEVVENLPSVKKLAEIYTQDGATNQNVPLNKPKKIVLRKTFLTNEEGDASDPPEAHQKVSKTSSDSFVPNYNHNYHPAMPIASITARSIPSQIRADLKKSYSYDDESIVRHGEREGSPEIQAGVTRNSIAFFENLQKK